MAGLIDKITNILMPEEEYEEAMLEKDKKVVNISERPVLTVHTNTIPELKVKVYVAQNFEQVNVIADALKAKEAAMVNYEEVEYEEQRRICDFLNGVVYILEGSVHRVSETMVLYAPPNVEISKELCSYSVPTYVKHSV